MSKRDKKKNTEKQHKDKYADMRKRKSNEDKKPGSKKD